MEFKLSYSDDDITFEFRVVARDRTAQVDEVIKQAIAHLPKTPSKQSQALMLTEVGPNKIQVIKAVRTATGLGLKEAKDLIERPLPVCIEVSDRGHRENALKTIRSVGGQAHLS